MNEAPENELQAVDLPKNMPEQKSQAKPVHRVRRVGTFTMGFALIITGAVLCIGLFNPKFDFITLFKLSPLILVALGIEILVAFTVGKGERFKYDFLSMFVCFCLIVASAGASCMPFFIDNFGPARSQAESALSVQWYDAIYEELKGNTEIDHVATDIYFTEYKKLDVNKTLQTLDTGDYARVTVTLDGSYADEKAFLAACEPVIAAVKSSGVQDPYLEIRTAEKSEKKKMYSLSLSGRYAFEKNSEQLTDNVRVEIYDEIDNTFYDAETYAQVQKGRAEENEQNEVVASSIETTENATVDQAA